MQAWADSLGGISFPLLSDFWPHGSVSHQYGVLRSLDGFTERAIFIVDKEGVIRFIDIHEIDQQPDNDVLRKVLREIEKDETPDEPADFSAESAGVYLEPPTAVDTPKGEIVIYCARWCKDCKKAKAWLDERGFSYVEVDIDHDQVARSYVRQLANGSLITPTFDIGGTIVFDFDIPKLEEALRKRENSSN